VVNAQSSKQSSKGEFKFLIQHRFGTLNSGFYNLWGLDNSQVRIGLDYGLSQRITLGLGRSSNLKQYDASAKINLLQQSQNTPLVLTAYSAIFVAHPSENTKNQANYDFLNQIAFANQIIIARKISSKLSLILWPTHLHLNVFSQTESLTSDPLFFGFGGRFKVSKKVSLNSEYFLALSEMKDDHQNMLSLGFDIETGGHVFSLHLSNSRGMNEQAFLAQTSSRWLDGGLYFGFNISRVFAW
jgi:hypothetical protein